MSATEAASERYIVDRGKQRGSKAALSAFARRFLFIVWVCFAMATEQNNGASVTSRECPQEAGRTHRCAAIFVPAAPKTKARYHELPSVRTDKILRGQTNTYPHCIYIYRTHVARTLEFRCRERYPISKS